MVLESVPPLQRLRTWSFSRLELKDSTSSNDVLRQNWNPSSKINVKKENHSILLMESQNLASWVREHLCADSAEVICLRAQSPGFFLGFSHWGYIMLDPPSVGEDSFDPWLKWCLSYFSMVIFHVSLCICRETLWNCVIILFPISLLFEYFGNLLIIFAQIKQCYLL